MLTILLSNHDNKLEQPWCSEQSRAAIFLCRPIMLTARAAAFLLYAFDAKMKGSRYTPELLKGLAVGGEGGLLPLSSGPFFIFYRDTFNGQLK
ncbi:hypothetical protein [Paenibacillus sp. KS-LC4]|uniref:hypothetical protein n=1 Tax=Paenibacillus sp. KS-LC4 TaxID=2979727 RepID=UPI0030CB6726